ncbi:hypothetical protein D3C73_1581120 [compost metagenome]
MLGIRPVDMRCVGREDDELPLHYLMLDSVDDDAACSLGAIDQDAGIAALRPLPVMITRAREKADIRNIQHAV